MKFMKRWSALGVALCVSVGGLAFHADALAQDAPASPRGGTPHPGRRGTTPHPGHKAPRVSPKQTAKPIPAPHAAASTPRPAAAPARARVEDPLSGAAREAADVASKEAVCLREAARSVEVAALKLRTATRPEEIDKRRGELDFALGVIDECRNIAMRRLDPATPTPSDSAPAPSDASGPEGPAAAPSAPTPAPSDEPAPAPPSEPSKPAFRFGAIRIESGRIDAAALVSTLRGAAPQLTRCYEGARANTPGLQGAVQLRMRFLGRGRDSRPSAVIIPSSELESDQLHRCLAATMMRSSFGRAAPGSQISVTLGFARER